MRLGPELPSKSWSALPLTWATSKIPMEEGSRRGGTITYSDRKVCAFLKLFLVWRWNREYLLHKNCLSSSCSLACSGHQRDKDQVTLVAMNFVGGAILTKHHKSPSLICQNLGRRYHSCLRQSILLLVRFPEPSGFWHHAHCPSFCYTDSLCKGPCSLHSSRTLVASTANSCSIQLCSAQVISFAQ